jgi:hypothetical protein
MVDGGRGVGGWGVSSNEMEWNKLQSNGGACNTEIEVEIRNPDNNPSGMERKEAAFQVVWVTTRNYNPAQAVSEPVNCPNSYTLRYGHTHSKYYTPITRSQYLPTECHGEYISPVCYYLTLVCEMGYESRASSLHSATIWSLAVARHAVYVTRNTEARSRNNYCGGKAMCYIFWMFLSSTLNECAVWRHLWPLWLYHIYPHYLINGAIFGKSYWIVNMCFDFLYNLGQKRFSL